MNSVLLRSIPVAALTLLLAMPALAQSNVTFQVDMNAALTNCRLVDGLTEISVRGSFNDWAGGTHVLTDANNDGVFTGTFEVPNGDIQYKFFGFPEYLVGWEDGDNRQATVSGDATLAVATFNKSFTSICPTEGQNNVTFRVDLSEAAENCAITSGSQIEVRGSFNNWQDPPHWYLQNIGDDIYAGTFSVAPGEYGYKFYGTPDERIGWESGGDRSLTVSDDVLLDIATFRKDGGFGDFCAAAEYEINFEVDMSVQVLAGRFNPVTDRLFVAGEAFGWGPGDDNEMSLNPFAGADHIYTASITRTLPIPSENPHKFIITDAQRENIRWEPNNPQPGTNDYFFYITGEEPEAVVDVPRRYFGMIGPDDVLTQQTTVTFVVDLRPAYYFLEDNDFLPADSQTGEIPDPSIDGLFVNGPLPDSALEDDAPEWATWGPEGLGQIESRRFYDDGTHGDAVAGDMFYTRTYTFPAGTPRTLTAKFGINGYDNEAGFAVNQHLTIEGDENVVVHAIFGCVRQADGTYTAHFSDEGNFVRAYQPYLVVDNTGDTPTCTVVREGGFVVSNEPTVNAPKGLMLEASYPNPASGVTTFAYSIPQAAQVSLEVFDLMGRRVAVVVNEVQQADSHRVSFDASGLSSGVYLYRLVAGDEVVTRRMTVVR
jgi:hypothetical protein